MSTAADPVPAAPGDSIETVTLAGGCFWCLEAIFLQARGVRSVESGYCGGSDPTPSYQDVCTGTTGHAEAVQVAFDPKILSLHDIFSIFFTVHDPTTLNRQGADIGSQYRSAIFYRDEAQKTVAESVMKEIGDAKIWGRPIVTQIVPFVAFYKAEAYHERYYERNPEQGYCRVVIEPKVRKFREKFRDKLAAP
jgi:peptide-methionine (S)-S-oxide reductase